MSEDLLTVLILAIGILVLIEILAPFPCRTDKFDELNLPQDPKFDKDDKLYMVDTGKIDDILPPNAKCSKSCCAQQWPLPPGLLPEDPDACSGKYIPSNLTCSNEHTTGCLCVPRKMHNALKNHGIIKD